ncbi:carbohydrate-binding protein [Vibrio sp. PP-XX7]
MDEDGQIVTIYEHGETTPSIQVTVDTKTTVSVTVQDNKGAKDSQSVIKRDRRNQVRSHFTIKIPISGEVSVCTTVLMEALPGQSPCVTMAPAGNDWYQYTVEIDAEYPFVFAPNSCHGSWDNNGGQNYTVTEGTWQVNAGVIQADKPADLDTNLKPSAQIVADSLSVSHRRYSSPEWVAFNRSRWNNRQLRLSTGETTPDITRCQYNGNHHLNGHRRQGRNKQC